MSRTSKLLKSIAKGIPPPGQRYYIVKDRFSSVTKTIVPLPLVGPHKEEEIGKKLKKLNDKEAYIATWDGKKWNRVEVKK